MKNTIFKMINDINPDFTTADANSILDNGLLDSLQIMQLVINLSDAYNIEIDPDDVNFENFNSIDGIERLIKQANGSV